MKSEILCLTCRPISFLIYSTRVPIASESQTKSYLILRKFDFFWKYHGGQIVVFEKFWGSKRLLLTTLYLDLHLKSCFTNKTKTN